MPFLRNIERIGEILAYEMSKSLTYKTQIIETPLAEKPINLSTNTIIVFHIKGKCPTSQWFIKLL